MPVQRRCLDHTPQRMVPRRRPQIQLRHVSPTRRSYARPLQTGVGPGTGSFLASDKPRRRGEPNLRERRLREVPGSAAGYLQKSGTSISRGCAEPPMSGSPKVRSSRIHRLTFSLHIAPETNARRGVVSGGSAPAPWRVPRSSGHSVLRPAALAPFPGSTIVPSEHKPLAAVRRQSFPPSVCATGAEPGPPCGVPVPLPCGGSPARP